MAYDLQAAPAHDAPHQSEEFQPIRAGCVHGNARHFAGPSNVRASGPQAVLLGASASAPVPADTNLSIDQGLTGRRRDRNEYESELPEASSSAPSPMSSHGGVRMAQDDVPDEGRGSLPDLTEEQIQIIESCLPGNDGGRRTRRAELERYDLPADLTDAQADKIRGYIMMQFENYAKYGYSQEAMGGILKGEKSERGCTRGGLRMRCLTLSRRRSMHYSS